MADDNPPDPISSLASSAITAHELYRAYVDAGFTEAQAMQLIVAIVTVSIKKGLGE